MASQVHELYLKKVKTFIGYQRTNRRVRGALSRPSGDSTEKGEEVVKGWYGNDQMAARDHKGSVKKVFVNEK